MLIPTHPVRVISQSASVGVGVWGAAPFPRTVSTLVSLSIPLISGIGWHRWTRGVTVAGNQEHLCADRHVDAVRLTSVALA
jgi:hypothetical protein